MAVDLFHRTSPNKVRLGFISLKMINKVRLGPISLKMLNKVRLTVCLIKKAKIMYGWRFISKNKPR